MLFDEINSKNSAQQVMEEVVSLVEEEGFSAGEKIPSEKELMDYKFKKMQEVSSETPSSKSHFPGDFGINNKQQ